ncbi:MAG: hypothetical protein ACKV19_06960 [Verrucomicrobiales bacterium]
MASKIKPFVLHHSSGYVSSSSSGLSCLKARYRRQGNVANLVNHHTCPNAAKKIYLDQVLNIPIGDGQYFWVCCDQVDKLTKWGFLPKSVAGQMFALGAAAVAGAALAWWICS